MNFVRRLVTIRIIHIRLLNVYQVIGIILYYITYWNNYIHSYSFKSQYLTCNIKEYQNLIIVLLHLFIKRI